MYDQTVSSEKSHLKNHEYEKDLKYTFLCQWLLKPLGMWALMYHRVSILERVISNTLLFVWLFTILFMIVPTAYNVCYVERNLKIRVKVIASLGFCVFSTVKYCYIGANRKLLGRCLEHVEKDWKMVEEQDHRAIMLKQAGISRHLIIICMVCFYSGGMSFTVLLPFSSKQTPDQNSTIKLLAYPTFEFLDDQSSPTYEIVFLLQAFGGFIVISATIAAYSLTATFVTHICGQIQIQIIRLENLIGEVQEKNSFQKRLTVIVHDHVEVLRFSKNVDEAMGEICLTEIVASTFSLCLTEYLCLLEWRSNDMFAVATYTVLLFSFAFNVLIYCYVGQLLSDQCSQMGGATYSIRWYNLPPRKAYNFILLEAISLYPPKLSAGKIVDLTINTFGAVGDFMVNAISTKGGEGICGVLKYAAYGYRLILHVAYTRNAFSETYSSR